MFEYFEWLLLIFPLLGALLNGFLGKRFPPRVQNWIACGAVGAALLIALPLLVGESIEPGLVGRPVPFTWIRIWSGLRFIEGPFSLRIDALSITVSLTAIAAGLFIHIHAALHTKGGASRHITLALLNSTLAALLILALADNFAFLLLGWSLTGWCTRSLRNGRLDRDTAKHSASMLHLLSDACMLLAVAMMSRLFASLSLHDVITMTFSTVSEESLPNAGIALLLLTTAAIRSRQFPFQAWISDRGQSYARATADGLTSVLPGIYLLARMYPLIEQSPPVPSLLSWWGAITAFLMAIVAPFQPQIRQLGRTIASVQAGLLFLALGTRGYAIVFSFLPAFVLLHTLVQLMTEENPRAKSERAQRRARQDASTPRRWMLIFFLATAGGLPLLPGFTFYTQLIEWLFYENKAQWILSLLATLLLGASAARAGFSLRTRPKTEASPGTGILFLLVCGITILGLVSLASPSPLGSFLAPIFGPAGYLPLWWWFGITILIIGTGTGLGYVLAARQEEPSGSIGRWIAQGYRVKDLYSTTIARPLLATGRFVAETIEPRAISWTFGALAKLADRRASADQKDDSLTLSLLFFVLGTAAIAAFLLIW
jgi:NADH-quinone oxidoreductase subunit L